jgi:hypothetical protein
MDWAGLMDDATPGKQEANCVLNLRGTTDKCLDVTVGDYDIQPGEPLLLQYNREGYVIQNRRIIPRLPREVYDSAYSSSSSTPSSGSAPSPAGLTSTDHDSPTAKRRKTAPDFESTTGVTTIDLTI